MASLRDTADEHFTTQQELALQSVLKRLLSDAGHADAASSIDSTADSSVTSDINHAAAQQLASDAASSIGITADSSVDKTSAIDDAAAQQLSSDMLCPSQSGTVASDMTDATTGLSNNKLLSHAEDTYQVCVQACRMQVLRVDVVW